MENRNKNESFDEWNKRFQRQRFYDLVEIYVSDPKTFEVARKYDLKCKFHEAVSNWEHHEWHMHTPHMEYLREVFHARVHEWLTITDAVHEIFPYIEDYDDFRLTPSLYYTPIDDIDTPSNDIFIDIPELEDEDIYI